MKTSIEHLPRRKRDELCNTVEIIREEVDAEMIILFGSYARGDWVEELAPDRHHYKYQSDFDIFILSKTRKIANKIGRSNKLKDRLYRQIQTPIELISESVGHFNHCLREGRYFYTDIKKEGILLFNPGNIILEEPLELSIKAFRSKAEKYFDHWFNSALEFSRYFQMGFKDQLYKTAAFQLHQVTERLYSAILLVLTDYRPKTHDLDRLGKLAAAQEPILLEIFPKGTEVERERFELLQKAYLDARYSENYNITREDLQWLAERVSKLQQLTEKICKEKIESFK